MIQKGNSYVSMIFYSYASDLILPSSLGAMQMNLAPPGPNKDFLRSFEMRSTFVDILRDKNNRLSGIS